MQRFAIKDNSSMSSRFHILFWTFKFSNSFSCICENFWNLKFIPGKIHSLRSSLVRIFWYYKDQLRILRYEIFFEYSNCRESNSGQFIIVNTYWIKIYSLFMKFPYSCQNNPNIKITSFCVRFLIAADGRSSIEL